MQTKISKWGNSYAIRIPGTVVDRLTLSEGERLTIDIVGETIRLAPDRLGIRRYPLKELFKNSKPIKLTKEDRKWLDMPSVGKEVV